MTTMQLARKILHELGARANVMYGEDSFQAVVALIEEFNAGWQKEWDTETERDVRRRAEITRRALTAETEAVTFQALVLQAREIAQSDPAANGFTSVRWQHFMQRSEDALNKSTMVIGGEINNGND